MPTSNLAVWPDILLAVQQVPHSRVLDVGPGHGKAAVLLREYVLDPPVVIDAVEAWEPYVPQFRLRSLYNRVFVGDVTAETWQTRPGQTVAAQGVLESYSVVLMGDVIEHIPMDKALDLLARIPAPVVICTPVAWFDNDPHHIHPPTEEHVSHWTGEVWDRVHRDIRPLEVRYQTVGGWVIRTAPL